MLTKAEWEQRYQTGDTPWELGMPRQAVQDLFHRYVSAGTSVLEVGCGMGTNTFWLAKQGYKVTAFDLSEKAIALAREQQSILGTEIDFHVGDILQGINVTQSFPIIFSCAVFNQMQDEDKQNRYVSMMANYCEKDGYWLDITPSAEKAKEITAMTSAKAPPYLSATQIVNAVDPCFWIIEMCLTEFIVERQDIGKVVFYAWASVFQKR